MPDLNLCHHFMCRSSLGNTQKPASEPEMPWVQQDPAMAAMVQNMHSQNYRENITSKMEDLKKDPEVAPILEEIEKGGPAAMMK